MKDTKKKVLNFLFSTADRYPPFRVDVTVLFGNEIAGRGHKIDWVMQSEESCYKSYLTEWSGGRVWVGKTDRGETRIQRLRKHIFSIINSLNMFKLAYRNNYDFIQVKDQFIAGVLGLFVARLNDIPFYFWLSYPYPEAALYEARQGTARYRYFYVARGVVFKFLLYKIILPGSDHVFVQSDQMKKDISACRINAEKITPVPMGVDGRTISAAIDKIQELPDLEGDSIVYVGTLIRVRKIDFLVRVLDLVRNERPEARLYLVGWGEDSEDIEVIEQQAQALGLRDMVHITGFLSQSEAFGYVLGATVCVSPFYPTPILNSTSPTKIVEYMALGKPVVANDHPEQKVVIEESGGGICVPYNECAFSEAILTILGDTEKAEQMGTKGRNYVFQKRSYQKIADMVEAQYINLVSSTRVREKGSA